jgi:hypothetical protein
MREVERLVGWSAAGAAVGVAEEDPGSGTCTDEPWQSGQSDESVRSEEPGESSELGRVRRAISASAVRGWRDGRRTRH